MLQALIHSARAQVRHSVRGAARKAGLGAAAALCLIVAAGFLLSAAWIAIAAAQGTLFASLMIGLGIGAVGLVLLAVALVRPRPADDPLAERLAALDDARLEALNRAAAGGPGEMERALRGLLTEAGLTPPAKGASATPALAAALVFGLTLALQSRRR